MALTAALQQRLARLPAGAGRLAMLCSPAVVLQPELLRAVRLHAAPELDAGDESDLWWSALVISRSPQAVVLHPQVLGRLRDQLAGSGVGPGTPGARAWTAIEECHRQEPATVRLEEQITWSAISRGAAAGPEIEAGLEGALTAFVDEGRAGIAHWWPGAWARLPEPARQSVAARRISLATSSALGGDAVPVDADAHLPFDAVLDAALRGVPDVALGVLREGAVLRVGEVDRNRGAAVLVPDTPVRVVDVEWHPAGPAGGFASDVVTERIAVRAGEVVTREIGEGPARLRTARGVEYELPLDVAAESPVVRPIDIPPLGASFDGTGTTFAVVSRVADAVELCLFDEEQRETRIRLDRADNHVWQAHLPGVGPGQRYGFRVHGPYDPAAGHRCNPAKLLLDPYAKAIEGQVDGDPALYSYLVGSSATDDRVNVDDSAPHTMRSVVANSFFDWGSDRPPRRDLHESVIYEAHVRGLSMTHPEVPAALRGTYAGIAHPAILRHLADLGVTALELMPVHQFVEDPTLVAKGLSTYWGYDSIGYFAPHHGYSSSGQRGEQVQEFKQMVKALHEAGIEVILDVVFNHTAEGDAFGPTLCFRGLDNAAYYRLDEDDRSRYVDTSGMGNSPWMRSPDVLKLIMDSLRYWVSEMHVDGFRFDLAATLARDVGEVDRLSVFFDLVQQDPVVSQVKLIAEPWDIGPGGYQVGNFPAGWSEWNARYRDVVRDFWRGEPGMLADFATRISGSSDLYHPGGRSPGASINYVTAHDGFTLRDLVSYDVKHNAANGQGNRDGSDANRSWNCGVEGDTSDPEILELRARQQRNFIATLLLSQGVPLFGHGDEMNRTQQGNNNVYCQDNELSWMNWSRPAADEAMLDFARRLIDFRHQHPVFRQSRFFALNPRRRSGVEDVAWFTPLGTQMTSPDWASSDARSFALLLNGGELLTPDRLGRRVTDDSFLLLFNASTEHLDFALPPAEYGLSWGLVLDTAAVESPLRYTDATFRANQRVPLVSRSMLVLGNFAGPRSVVA